jgi:hypothetical protein
MQWSGFHSHARNGDGMHRKTSRKEREGETQRIEWLAYTGGSLLLISAGLQLLAHRVFGQIDVYTLLWALSLGFWTYVLGFAGVLLLSVLWLVDWWRVGASRKTMNPLPFTESKHRRLKESELEGPLQILEQDMASVVPGRSSWDCNDGNEALENRTC